MIITSFANQTVKFIRKLEQKKYRQETGQYFIEGLRTVGEAVQTGAPIESLIISPELLISDFGQRLLTHPSLENVERIEVSTEIYKKIAHKNGPQGIGALVHQNWQKLNTITVQPEDVWVILDEIGDPGNLGTILRTADAVGCRGVILTGFSTDPYDPTAVKASMGSIFSLELVQTDWAQLHVWYSAQKLTLVGTSDSAEMDYQAVRYQRPLGVVMGSERHGLSPEVAAACDWMVHIPMEGRCDSLNLAVATGVILYEVYNQTKILDTIEP